MGNRNGTIDLFSGLDVAPAASSSQKKFSPCCKRRAGKRCKGLGDSLWPGMLWVAGAWQAWISKAAVGQGLAVAEQPGDAGGMWGDVGWVGGPQPPCPMAGCVLCSALYFGMLHVCAGAEIKLGRREGMKKTKKNNPKNKLKPDQA